METDRGATNSDQPTIEFPKHHPGGLWVLFTTEMWERFCYYGMRAFLTLYIYSTAMSESNPGLGWTQAQAYDFYGTFTGLVYLMPLLCGWVADYFIGQHRSMLFGGILIAIGEFTLCATEFVRSGVAGTPVTLAADPFALFTFYAGLALIIIGTGFFKPCVSVMVGQLYGEGDPRRDSAFTIFYMGINIGALFSPLIAGTVAEKIGWEWGFFFAGIGMLFGLFTYTVFRPKYLAHLGLPPQKADKLVQATPEQIEKARWEENERTRPLTSIDRDKVYVILAMSLFTIAFWLSFEQAGSSLNVFAKESTDRAAASDISKSSSFAQSVLLINEYAFDWDDSLKSIQAAIGNDSATVLETRMIENKARITPFGKIRRFLSTKEEDKPIDTTVNELKIRTNSVYPELTIPLNKDHTVEITLVAPEIKKEEVKKDAPEKKNENEITPAQISGFLADVKQTEAEIEVSDETSAKPDNYRLTFEGGKLSGQSLEDLDKALASANITLTENSKNALVDVFNKYPAQVAGLRESLARTIKQYQPGISRGTFPATWYQSANAIGIVIFAPIFAFMWVFLAARKLEPSTPVKFGIGLLLVSLSCAVMVPGAIEAKNTNGLAAPYWLLLSFLLATWGELCLSPVGLSMVSKLAPLRYASLLMGFWFISSAIANKLGGTMAAIFGSKAGGGLSVYGDAGGLADFFLLMAIIPAVTGFIVLLCAGKLKRMMHGVQ